jgi:demethylmenaquinone methyltransferase/2-methoxy-6-polyprenyl-1,4-benzoquinol methylase
MELDEHKSHLLAYYAARAPYYDRTYDIPFIQKDLKKVAKHVMKLFKGRRVLEAACGTGYWTRILSETAEHITATDVGRDMLDVARAKEYPAENVKFVEEDAFSTDGVEGEFGGGFHFRFVSHLPRDSVGAFLGAFHSKLSPGAQVAFGDDLGEGYTDIDDGGNRGHVRKVKDGRTFPIIKNGWSEGEIRELLGDSAGKIRYTATRFFWLVQYKLEGR